MYDFYYFIFKWLEKKLPLKSFECKFLFFSLIFNDAFNIFNKYRNITIFYFFFDQFWQVVFFKKFLHFIYIVKFMAQKYCNNFLFFNPFNFCIVFFFIPDITRHSLSLSLSFETGPVFLGSY